MSLNRDVVDFLQQLTDFGAPPITEGTVAEARANNVEFLRETGIDGPHIADVSDIVIVAEDGRGIAARHYRDAHPSPAVLVFFHGGGWVLGDLEGHDGLCRLLAAGSAMEVVNVDYRLAPEDPFPAGLEDAFDAVQWVERYLADGRPVVVAGDSSGGNLAAAVALRARDEHGPGIALQVLLYPVLDHDLTTESYRRFGTGHLLLSQDMAWFFDQYVPEPDRRYDPYVSPLRARDLADVAPTYIVVGGHDPLRDEDLAYAGRLEADGVPVTVRNYEGMVHGFLLMPKAVPSAAAAVYEVVAEVRSRVADLVGSR